MKCGALVKTVNNECRYTLNGEIVVLIGVDQCQCEVFAQCQVLVELIFRSNGKHNETVAQRVAVVALAMSQNAGRIGQAATVLEHTL